MTRLVVPIPLLEPLQDAAAAALPEECCGLLVGRRLADGWGLTRSLASPNLARDRRHFFEIDPALHIALLRSLRAAGGAEEVIGHYHSHPAGPARPSPRDLAAAHDPEALWLILGGPATGGEIAVWRPVFAGGQAVSFAPVVLEIAGDPAN